MDKLDSLVTDHLIDRFFHPERLIAILASLSARRAEKDEALSGRITTLQREVADAEDRLKRLYALVEQGLTDLDDVLKDRLNVLKGDHDRGRAALERAKLHSAPSIHSTQPSSSGSVGPCAKTSALDRYRSVRPTYLQSLIDVVEVDDRQIRIKGSKDLLERAVPASQSGADWC